MEKKWREKEIPSLFVSINFPFCSASHVSRTRLSTRSTKKLVLRKNLSQDFCELIFRFDIETALKNNARIDRIDRTDRKIRNNFRGREIRMAKQAPPNQTVIPFYLINPASRKSSPPHFSSRSAKSKPLCAIKREKERELDEVILPRNLQKEGKKKRDHGIRIEVSSKRSTILLLLLFLPPSTVSIEK